MDSQAAGNKAYFGSGTHRFVSSIYIKTVPFMVFSFITSGGECIQPHSFLRGSEIQMVT